MTLNEFDIIQMFFHHSSLYREDILLGIGDDCALVVPPLDHALAITTDTLVEGVHFLKNTAAYDIGFKALAVNLSDLAAMGAKPAWFTLALSLPEADETWLKGFSSGLFALANRYAVPLIGGDLTRGSLTITIQAHGFVRINKALRRDGAKPGDAIYVTHTLGDAALALLFLTNQLEIDPSHQPFLLDRLHRPEPRLAIAQTLGGIAHAAIDISDGLLADLGHILQKSGVGATINVDKLPLSEGLRHSVAIEKAYSLALHGGDDYELCFTLPPGQEGIFDFPCTCIGKINEQLGCNLQYSNGKSYETVLKGYQHF